MTTNNHLIRVSINKAYIATFLVSKMGLSDSVGCLSHHCDKISDEKQFKEGSGGFGAWGFVSAHRYEEKTGTSQQQEPKAAAHTHLHLQSGNSNGC